MEPTLPPVSIEPGFANTLYDLILHADPVVKGVMLLLALASVLCWAIILEKALRLTAFSTQLGRLETFAETFSTAPAPQAWLASALLNAAYRLDLSPQESRIDREARLEKAMRLAARLELSRLQPRLRFLATVGSTAPFIGLFGTVWGIMNSFTAIAAQKDTSLAVVAPGIAEALFATALGLVAAIPAVIAYNQISGSFARAGERINFAIAVLADKLPRMVQTTQVGE
jgi:biopolymer transport protein ExbB/TolQ